MGYNNSDLLTILQGLNIGSSVAESDTLLETARVETSAFHDLLNDRVDLIPGTKGSGKSALFRIFVHFLPDKLLDSNKVVVAHGVQSPGDPVFHAFKEEFSKLDEEQFVSFWCIYLVSLANEQFIKGDLYKQHLNDASKEIEAFQRACVKAHIPEIKAQRSLRDILQWTLGILSRWSPKIIYKIPDGGGELELNLFGEPVKDTSPKKQDADAVLPKYINEIRESLENILKRSQLSLWLVIDRLDEIFPRRSELERIALRGLLRTLRIFSSESIRVKIFLRDDMLEEVISSGEGFPALTHITARQADTLRWTEEQILSIVIKRICADNTIAIFFDIDNSRLDASAEYREESFYKLFPPTIHKGTKQSTTLRWIYTRCADGNGVVTPRDVIDLLSRAKQKQLDEMLANSAGTSEWLIGPLAIQYGLQELSNRKKLTYLEAEFPHLWKHIMKFIGGKTEYSEKVLKKVLGDDWNSIADDLVSIGLLAKTIRGDSPVYSIPFLYRHGLNLTQGKA